MDASERPIWRSVDAETQREHYSEKKQHMEKHLILADPCRKILFLSHAVEGNVHDKRLADQMEFSFLEATRLLKDTGF